MVLTALAEGLGPSAAERVAGLPTGHDHHLAMAVLATSIIRSKKERQR